MRFRFTLQNDTLGAHILESDPKGWDKAEILFKRSPKYHGVFYEKNIALEFYCGAGKEYIDQVYDEQGIDAVINIKIEISCACNEETDSLDYSEDYSDDYGSEAIDGCEFEQLYLGKIDLKTWNTLNGKTSVNIIQEGITQTVMNRMDTAIDLTKEETLDGTVLPALTPIDLNLHSKLIQLLSKISIDGASNYTVSENALSLTSSPAANIYCEFPFEEVEYDDMEGLILPFDPFVTSGTSNSAFEVGEPEAIFTNYLDTKTLDITYNFIGTVTELATENRTYDVIVFYKIGETFSGSSPVTLSTIDAGVSLPLNTLGTYNINISGTFSVSLAENESLWIYTQFQNFTVNGVDINQTITASFTTCSVAIKEDSTTAATTAKSFLIHEVCERVFQSISDQADAFRSDYFGRKGMIHGYTENGCACFNAVTNGALIRNFPIADTVDTEGIKVSGRPVRISANELFDSLNAIYNLGMGIEKDGDNFLVRVEPKEYFYDDTVLFQLSNVPNIERSVAPEYYFNRLEVGYDKWQIKEVNGLEEFNSKRQYDLGIKSVDNPLAAVSRIIASGYVLEMTRRKQFQDSSTEDFDFDNDNFIICLNRSVDGSDIPTTLTTAEKDENFTTVDNLLSPETSYNLRISPGRNALRWSSVLNGGLLKYPARSYKFTSGEGNFKLETEFTSDTCTGSWNNNLFIENQDIQWDDADNSDSDPIWEPEIVSFKYPLTMVQSQILMNNPIGVIEISNTSEDYEAFYILEAKYKPVGGMTDFKLLKKWVS
jgi:hypothetical protein